MSTLKGRAVVSWSGGKDSCLACHRAMKEGWQVVALLNMVSREFQRSGAHGVDWRLMRQQGEAVGIPMLQPQYDRDDYEAVFKAALSQLREQGVTALITGDIYLEEHRAWVERVAGEAGMEAVLPLWGLPTLQVVRDFLVEGFKALVVALMAERLGEEWLGRWLDGPFLEELMARGGVDPAGEGGEFHTFVVDGPLFQCPVPVWGAGNVLREGRWFLDLRPGEEG